jgi:hypothetical protein
MNRLNISLIDPKDGSLFDLQGNEWCMLLQVNY